MATRTFLYERSLRTGEMVRFSIQPTCSMLAGCVMENRFGRVVLHGTLPSANNTQHAHFHAPEETRHIVDDLATIVVVNSEDDVVTTICSAVW